MTELADELEAARVDLALLLRAINEGDPRSELRIRVEDIQRRLSAAPGSQERVEKLEAENARLREALKPFADCCEFIADDEDDEEWAKFRLLIKNYRSARAALSDGGSDEG